VETNARELGGDFLREIERGRIRIEWGEGFFRRVVSEVVLFQ
jgi:hypothetical protein